MGVEFHSPRHERMVTIDGWTVPLIEGVEQDGGEFSLTLDGRYGLTLPVQYAEQVTWFIANVVAVCWGYYCHPTDAEFPDKDDPDWLSVRARKFAHVPHPTLAPRRVFEITALVRDDETAEGDSPA